MLIATAGHIDHGKTALVRALSGAETDRLPEEKARGISIDLGFAYWTPDAGGTVGFVDVPGHERFVRNMLAGVSSVDFALLVVAADDGVMPQTVEHVEILDLLGITQGIVAITKADSVPEDRIEAVKAQAEALLSNTGLSGAPIHVTSAVSGLGVETLGKAILAHRAKQAPRQIEGRAFRMAIDRAFTIQGAGTVVTGTIVDGVVTVGDRLMLAPLGRSVRVRGMHTASRSVEQAGAGTRAALNITGVELAEVHRGDWLLERQNVAASDRFDVRLGVLHSAAGGLKHNSRVHLHHGTADIPARVLLPGRAQLAPGASAMAHLILDRPSMAAVGDRLVLRDQSGTRTLGGGTVVDPLAPSRRRRDTRAAIWQALSTESPEAVLKGLLEVGGQDVDLRHLQYQLNLTSDALAALRQGAPLFAFGPPPGRAISAADAAAAQAAILDTLARFHDENPKSTGMRQADMLAAIPTPLSREAALAIVRALSDTGKIVAEGALLRLSRFRPQSDNSRAKAWADLVAAAADFTDKSFGIRELADRLGHGERQVAELVAAMRGNGDIWRISQTRFLTRSQVFALADAARKLSQKQPEGFSAADLRDVTVFGRNLLIEVLEYFDQITLTRRAGNLRVVRGETEPILARAAQAERALSARAYLPTNRKSGPRRSRR